MGNKIKWKFSFPQEFIFIYVYIDLNVTDILTIFQEMH